jgi:hypothetical protein
LLILLHWLFVLLLVCLDLVSSFAVKEELTITTGIAVAEAKSKILDKYEKLEKERSVTNIFAIVIRNKSLK